MKIKLYRSPKNKSNPYTQIDNRLLDDERYHPDAVNLICHALRHDENFKKTIPHLKKRFGPSGYRRRKRLAMECGLLKVFTYFVPGNLGGMHKRYRYEIYENPHKTESIFHRQIQCVDSSSTGIDTCKRKLVREKEKKEKKKKQVLEQKSIPSLPTGDTPEPPSLFSRDQVKIKQELYEALVEEYTEPIVTMAIDRMNAYMEQSGKYRGYACHGAKLKHWLEKDAEQYRSKLEKQKQEAEQKQREQKQREEYALWIQQQEAIRLEKERQAQEEANRMEIRVKQNLPILEKYKQMYPNYISWDKYSIDNGTYSFMGKIEIMSMSAENLEHDLVTRISEYEKKLELESKQAEKRTEMGVESNNDAQVVCIVKKMETQSKIGHSVLNHTHPIQKSPRNIGYQAQMDQNRWKNQLTSVLKSYETYPMKL